MKTRTGSTRGSVLVMVVGLLTIIAMLGSVFLLVARLNRRTAEALDAAAPDSLVAGIVNQVAEQMKVDLNMGVYDDKGDADTLNDEYMPYLGGAAAAAYADFPGEGNDGWLASNYTASVWTDKLWPHITNISGELDNAERKVTGVAVNHKNLRDTDSDGLADAILYRMEVFNSNGDEYCAAVRVIDLGGLICVNTGGEYPGTTPPAYTTPVWVNLKGFLNASLGDDTIYGSLCAQRGSSDNMGALWTNLASHPSNTVSPYVAFGVGDEMYLRWLTSSQNSSTFTGPLYDATKTGEAALPIQVRRFLTTQGASRNLLRRPRPNLTTRIPLREMTAGSGDLALSENDPNAAVKRTALYELLSEALGGTDDAKITAAHFVANLWAYMDGQSPDQSYAFTVTGHSDETDPVVYGVVPQPFITEAYAYNLQATNDGGDPLTWNNDEGWAYAIELYNPSNRDIPLGNATSTAYKLAQGENTLVFPAGATIPAGGHYTVYSFGGQFIPEGSSTRRDAEAGDFGFNDPAPEADPPVVGIPASQKYRWNSLDFTSSEPVRLVRIPAGNDNDPEIEMDNVSKTNFVYVAINRRESNSECKNGRRDDGVSDRVELQRMATFVGTTYTGNAVKIHTLGSSNNYADWPDEQKNQIPFTNAGGNPEYCGGFSIPQSAAEGMNSVSDVMNLFLTGPIISTAMTRSLPEQLTQDYRSDPSRGRANELSATTLSGTSYPAVPFGVALGELFAVIPGYNPASDPVDSRVYGRLNINTATRETLLMLPWPDTVNGVTLTAEQKGEIVDAILEYRKPALPAPGGHGAFTTPGQLATVLGSHFDTMTTGETPAWDAIAESSNNYLEERGKLYKAVADLITVNSDVYAITMRVNLEDTRGVVKYGWNYISVIDRGSCFKPSDTPSPILPADKVK